MDLFSDAGPFVATRVYCGYELDVEVVSVCPSWPSVAQRDNRAEAVDTVAIANPCIFRQFVDLAAERYLTNRTTFHLCADVDELPAVSMTYISNRLVPAFSVVAPPLRHK